MSQSFKLIERLAKQAMLRQEDADENGCLARDAAGSIQFFHREKVLPKEKDAVRECAAH